MFENKRIQKPNIEFAPPVYYCKKATKPFVLDGNIEKEFWSNADFTQNFIDIEGESKDTPRFRTRAKMLWDDKNVYFGAILEGDEIWGNIEERDSVIFHDNDFEIFIDPDSDTHQYYEFEMNAKNAVWDLFLTKPYRDFGKALNSWDIKGLKTAVHIDGELNNPAANNIRWMVEIVMPFESLVEGANTQDLPVCGEFWRVNFSRVQWKVDIQNNQYYKKKQENSNQFCPEDNWVWAPTGVINIHYPELWGFMFFVNDSEVYEIPIKEYDKWQLRCLYYEEYANWEEEGCFTDKVEKLGRQSVLSIDPLIQVTNNTFEISCLSRDGKTELAIQSDGRTYERCIKNQK